MWWGDRRGPDEAATGPNAPVIKLVRGQTDANDVMRARLPSATRSAAPAPHWPPTAMPAGPDPSPVVLIGIVLVLFVVVWVGLATIAGPLFSGAGWRFAPSPSAVARQLIAPRAIELAAWIAVIGGLGWRRVAGLVAGRPSAWGMVPLGLFGIAAVMTVGQSTVASKGALTVALAGAGSLLSALTEEVAFRGFLLHGLSRRLGGTGAVLLSSALFATFHVPVFLANQVPELDGALIGMFGFGVAMCRIRVATGSLWVPAGVHALYNLTLVGLMVWGFPQGQAWLSYLWLARGLSVMGIVLAADLVLRWLVPTALRHIRTTTAPTSGALIDG